MLVTCAYLVDSSKPWVMQSLFLTAIGDARDKGARALEAFAYRYADGESAFERFHVHKTIFPSDFLADFGFVTVRMQGRVELARLELGGLVTGRRRDEGEDAARRARGVRPGAGAAALLALTWQRQRPGPGPDTASCRLRNGHFARTRARFRFGR